MKHLNLTKKGSLKDSFLAIGIITGFVFIVAFSSLYVSDAIKNNNACGCVIPIPFMILILSSLGIFIGSFSYYFIASKYLKERKERTKDINLTLKFLEKDERLIVENLIKNKEGLKQSDLERLTGIHRVQIHRLVKKLLNKGIVKKEVDGKINKITLNENLLEIF